MKFHTYDYRKGQIVEWMNDFFVRKKAAYCIGRLIQYLAIGYQRRSKWQCITIILPHLSKPCMFSRTRVQLDEANTHHAGLPLLAEGQIRNGGRQTGNTRISARKHDNQAIPMAI